MKYVYWLVLLIPMFLVALVFRLLAPIACLFIHREPYQRTVKRLNRESVLLPRDRLVWWLSWFDTFDNPTDEYWYGAYGDTATKPDSWYHGSAFHRWLCRVHWLWRNSAYGFNYSVVGIAKDSSMAFHYQTEHWLPFGYYNNMNIGWKPHPGFDKLMYAGRVVGLKKRAIVTPSVETQP